MRFNENEIKFINENYPSMGSRYCANELNFTIPQIQEFARRNKLKILNRSKACLYYRSLIKTTFNHETITSINSSEAAYVLGFLWADGSLGNSKNCGISLEIVSEDMLFIKPILDKLGPWKYYERQRMNWKPITSAKINNRILYEFLIDNDYGTKSTTSPCKILDKIPDNLKHYFFRGLIDGDGCFYVNAKQYLYQFSITSTVTQNWKFFTGLLERLGIRYHIKYTEKINKKSEKFNSDSCLRITNKNEILKLGEYIYFDFESDKIGLPRKYEKYNLIKKKNIKN